MTTTYQDLYNQALDANNQLETQLDDAAHLVRLLTQRIEQAERWEAARKAQQEATAAIQQIDEDVEKMRDTFNALMERTEIPF